MEDKITINLNELTEIEEEEKEYYQVYDSETNDIKKIIVLG